MKNTKAIYISFDTRLSLLNNRGHKMKYKKLAKMLNCKESIAKLILLELKRLDDLDKKN